MLISDRHETQWYHDGSEKWSLLDVLDGGRPRPSLHAEAMLMAHGHSTLKLVVMVGCAGYHATSRSGGAMWRWS